LFGEIQVPSTQNPYQSPERWSTELASDKKLVKTAILLSKRRGERVGVGHYLSGVWRRELVVFLVVGLLLWALVAMEYPWVATLLGAMMLTRFLRDLVWYRVLARQWPATCELLDWEKIERLARQGEAEIARGEGATA
jgi:hypothetical protein